MNKLACDEDNALALKEHGDEFESKACQVIIECYR